MIKAKVTRNTFSKRSKSLPRALEDAIKKHIKISAVEVEGEAKRGIQRGPRSGRVYTRGTIVHQASSPGEFPKTDTGTLVASIHSSFKNSGLVAEVGTRLGYGTFLEFGTKKMAARPWLFPTFERLKPRFRSRYAKVIQEGFQRSGGSKRR